METPKGYLICSGYMGYVPEFGRYILFATETEYYEYIKEASIYENIKQIKESH